MYEIGLGNFGQSSDATCLFSPTFHAYFQDFQYWDF